MNQSVVLLRALKGAPLSVVLALFLEQKPLKNVDLQGYTGYNEDSIRAALRMLSASGMVARVPGRGWALVNQPGFDALAGVGDYLAAVTPGRRQAIDAPRRDARWKAALEEAHRQGIGEPKASQLADLEHVTADYIRRHVERARAQGMELGTAIYRIENGWPFPAEQETAKRYRLGKYAKFVE